MNLEEKQSLKVQYCQIMEEIRERIDAIYAIYAGTSKLPLYIRYEMSYLQLRMIAELIAIACLKAHGDLPPLRSKKILKTYEPSKILRMVRNIHPTYWPVPVSEHLDSEGVLESITPIDSEFLTSGELIKLWNECGDVLHRGSAISYSLPGERDMLKPAKWQRKIVGLLNRHFIALADGRSGMYVMMKTKETGRVLSFDLEISDQTRWPNWAKELHVRS